MPCRLRRQGVFVFARIERHGCEFRKNQGCPANIVCVHTMPRLKQEPEEALAQAGSMHRRKVRSRNAPPVVFVELGCIRGDAVQG
jgi:hypothetical protein